MRLDSSRWIAIFPRTTTSLANTIFTSFWQKTCQHRWQITLEWFHLWAAIAALFKILSYAWEIILPIALACETGIRTIRRYKFPRKYQTYSQQISQNLIEEAMMKCYVRTSNLPINTRTNNKIILAHKNQEQGKALRSIAHGFQPCFA